jgi:hypothetical protein
MNNEQKLLTGVEFPKSFDTFAELQQNNPEKFEWYKLRLVLEIHRDNTLEPWNTELKQYCELKKIDINISPFKLNAIIETKSQEEIYNKPYDSCNIDRKFQFKNGAIECLTDFERTYKRTRTELAMQGNLTTVFKMRDREAEARYISKRRDYFNLEFKDVNIDGDSNSDYRNCVFDNCKFIGSFSCCNFGGSIFINMTSELCSNFKSNGESYNYIDKIRIIDESILDSQIPEIVISLQNSNCYGNWIYINYKGYWIKK